MAWASIKLAPGLNTELTPTANRAGYTATGLGRFKNGEFQKMGGWTKFYPLATAGIPKKLHAWQDLAGNKRLAQGTTSQIDVITAGFYRDVAPQTFTTNPAINFATTSGSAVVTIVDTAVNSITNFDAVFFNTPVSVGGIILSGTYQVTQNISATSYTITAATNATSTVAAPGGTTPSFTTTNGSANVTVTFTAHGLVAGNDIVFPLSTTVGGIAISGRYVVQSITDANNFVITATNSASSSAGPTAMNSGNAGFLYWITVGPQAIASAYGASTYGTGPYGVGTPISGQTGTDITATDWSLDNFGELLISCPKNQGIFYWSPSSGYSNSSLVATGPYYNSGAFVSIGQQVIVGFGSTSYATIGAYQDPLLVRWSDVGNIFQWSVLVTTQAGSYRIPTGSQIVGGAATPLYNLIWTDIDVYAMNYIGATFAFGFNKIGSNCGLIAKHAHTQLAGVTYWMSSAAFFALSGGGVQQLPCSVWDAVFQDLDAANTSKCHAGSITAFGEVIFFYPSKSGGLGYCDKYVKYNTIENEWDYGSLQRNTWIDQSVLGGPIASSNSAIIYSQESGTDADNAPLNSFFQTGWFYIDEGEDIVFIDRIFPDFRWGLYNGSQNASILITIYAVKYPGDAVQTYGPFTITQATQFISQRLRARQIMLRVESNDTGSFWRLGNIRIRYSIDGRK